MRLIFLPLYGFALNPAGHLWESLREDNFANHVVANLDAEKGALTAGLATREA